jgi:hypothetical protein
MRDRRLGSGARCESSRSDWGGQMESKSEFVFVKSNRKKGTRQEFHGPTAISFSSVRLCQVLNRGIVGTQAWLRLGYEITPGSVDRVG